MSVPLDLAEIEAVFFALSHEARRHIVMLLGHSGGELPSGYLAKRFQHSWPTTTRHLKVLEDVGVERPAHDRPARSTTRVRKPNAERQTKMTDIPKLFRVTVEVANLDEA